MYKLISVINDAQIVAGVDEVGRGALAGSVYAAAVILNPQKTILGIDDSKKLSAKKREALYELITANALDYAISFAAVNEIDKLNILNASLLAMQRSINQLQIKVDLILIDGTIAPPAITINHQTIIGGDAKFAAIAAASIIAKVTRDREMIALDRNYPEYHFAQHKGYGTKAHLAAIAKYGALPIHRRSFAPIKYMT